MNYFYVSGQEQGLDLSRAQYLLQNEEMEGKIFFLFLS